MAVAYDNANVATGNGTTATVSLTCAANSLAVIGLWVNNNTAITSGPTFDGAATTSIAAPANGNKLLMNRYHGHASGSRTATASWTGAQDWAIGVITVTGFDTTTPVGTPQLVTNDSGTSLTTPSITGDANGMFVDLALMIYNAITAEAAQTRRVNADSIQGSFVSMGMSTKPGAASTTMNWTATETFGINDLIGVFINAAASGASLAARLSLLGVGR